MNTKVKIIFLGGTVANGEDDNLTKSCTSIQVRDGKKESVVLVDFGLWQGRKEFFIKHNSDIPVDPTKINAVLLTHSHIDHAGRIPILVKNGFGKTGGRFFSTFSTRDIAEIMLYDTEKLSAFEAKKFEKMKKKEKSPINGRKWKKNLAKRLSEMGKEKAEKFLEEIKKPREIKKPEGWEAKIFDKADIKKALELFKCHDYESSFFKLAGGIHAKFYPSGHILGGAICIIKIDRKIDGKDKPIMIGFSGDLGRRDGIILPAPKLVEEPLDYWITESTYGNINHPERKNELERFLKVVQECGKRKSKIMIPSFTLERTQELIYLLSLYMDRGNMPKIPIYLDSPMAVDITEVYANNWYSPMFKDQDKLGYNPFDLEENKYFKIIKSNEDSKTLARRKGPAIVIAGSGMGDGGRIRNHLKIGFPDPNNIVCVVGYAVIGTPVRMIVDKEPEIMMDRIVVPNRARVEKFGSFSAHADQEFLTHYLREIMRKSPDLKNIFINHGGYTNGHGLRNHFLSVLSNDWEEKIVVPDAGDEFVL
jgi:metallo-beta-lactamase family protein